MAQSQPRKKSLVFAVIRVWVFTNILGAVIFSIGYDFSHSAGGGRSIPETFSDWLNIALIACLVSVITTIPAVVIYGLIFRWVIKAGFQRNVAALVLSLVSFLELYITLIVVFESDYSYINGAAAAYTIPLWVFTWMAVYRFYSDYVPVGKEVTEG